MTLLEELEVLLETRQTYSSGNAEKCYPLVAELIQKLRAKQQSVAVDRIQESYEMLVNETDNPMTHRDRQKNQRLNDLLELFEYLQGEQEANPIIRWFDII